MKTNEGREGQIDGERDMGEKGDIEARVLVRI